MEIQPIISNNMLRLEKIIIRKRVGKCKELMWFDLINLHSQ